MQIYLNGAVHTITAQTSIYDLLVQLDVIGKRVAVELNEAIIPRSQHNHTFLQDGDKIEVIHAIAGG